MHCPVCKTTLLMPVKIEADLPAMGCPKCAGALLPLLYYRYWQERHAADDSDSLDTGQPVVVEDSHTALSCPKCGRIMTKYKVNGEVGNRLDLCASCDEAWLDRGEWRLLKSLELHHQLPMVFTDAWQHRVRQDTVEYERRKRYSKLLGENVLSEAERIRDWLANQPQRRYILEFISGGK